MAKRKTSDSVRTMRLVILGIALALILAVVAVTWFTLSRESENGKIEWKVATTTTTEKRVAGQPDETTTAPAAAELDKTATTNADGLPYDKNGSDRYAEWDGKYVTAEVVVKKDDETGKWAGFVADKVAKDCTGVYQNELGWWFVRNGFVDFNYNGIAGNQYGKWYIEGGKLNTHYSGAYTPIDGQKSYTVVEGKVAEFQQ
ncbi:MAG: hypothetical protein J6T14_04910 [Clostridia bacterium]|nr:hypothetical protein [Clostridia bacterium]MBP5272517.1 hypothetical protein [Clostridia bacterium]